MKKSNVYFLPLLGLFSFSCAGSLTKTNVPDAVISGFDTHFKGATASDWEKEGEYYEVEFTQNNLEQEALLNAAGDVLLIKNNITETELPEAVKSLIRQKYSGGVISDPERLQQGDQVYYQLELEHNGQDLQLVFSADGQEQSQPPYWD